MPRKKSEHYVNNKELLQAITVYRGSALIARAAYLKKYGVDAPKSGPWEGKPPISNYLGSCLLYTSPSPRDGLLSRMPSSA